MRFKEDNLKGAQEIVSMPRVFSLKTRRAKRKRVERKDIVTDFIFRGTYDK